MTVIQMSERELTRLRVLIDLSDRRLTVETAGRLMGVGRRQAYRLRRAFAADGPVALVSRKRGRPSNHRHGATFRRTILMLVREHYPDFDPTLAVEKLAARHGLRVGVETLRQWMMSDGLWRTVAIAYPRRISRDGGGTVWANWCRSTAPSMPGSRTVAPCARC
jgi:Winged helix-turn helix